MKTFIALLLLISPVVGIAQIDYQKSKITYVDFWASWCPPCLASFPWMNQMFAKYQAQGLNIVAVNLDEERSSAQSFLQKVPAKFAVVFTDGVKMAEKFGVKVMPSSFIVNPQGEVIYSHIGFNNEAKIELENKFKQLLK